MEKFYRVVLVLFLIILVYLFYFEISQQVGQKVNNPGTSLSENNTVVEGRFKTVAENVGETNIPYGVVPQRIRFSDDGKRYAFLYFPENAPNNFKDWLTASLPPPSPPTEGYLVLDGKIVISENRKSWTDKRLLNISYVTNQEFGFLKDGTFWYTYNEDGKRVLKIEDFDLPVHEFAFVYERAGDTFFVLMDRSDEYMQQLEKVDKMTFYEEVSLVDKRYLKETTELSEEQIVAEGLEFLTKIKTRELNSEMILSYIAVSPESIKVAKNGDYIISEVDMNSIDYTKSNNPSLSPIWRSRMVDGVGLVFRDNEVVKKLTHSDAEYEFIELFDVLESGPLIIVTERSDEIPTDYVQHLTFLEQELSINTPIRTIITNSNDDILAVVSDDSIKFNNGLEKKYEKIYPESAIFTSSNTIKYAAILNKKLVFIELSFSF